MNSPPIKLPLDLAVKLAAHEDELDKIYPAWRQKRPFGDLPIETLKRVKYLLKRCQHLRDGKDWEVNLVEGNKGRWFAHSVYPENHIQPPAPVTEQPLLNADALRAALQNPELAAQLKQMGVLT